jgi:hypothetical protein
LILESMGWYRLDWSGSGLGQVGDSCNHGNEPSVP